MTPPNVHILHPTSPPLAGYLRVGHTGHHKLEALHAADRPGSGRLVFDAAYAVGQADFLCAHKAAGREIVIDLNVAETATRQASKLKFGEEGVQKLVVDARSRLNRLRDALGALHEADSAAAPISASPLFRGNRPRSGGMSIIQAGRP
jgi:hypothetical protein